MVTKFGIKILIKNIYFNIFYIKIINYYFIIKKFIYFIHKLKLRKCSNLKKEYFQNYTLKNKIIFPMLNIQITMISFTEIHVICQK